MSEVSRNPGHPLVHLLDDDPRLGEAERNHLASFFSNLGVSTVGDLQDIDTFQPVSSYLRNALEEYEQGTGRGFHCAGGVVRAALGRVIRSIQGKADSDAVGVSGAPSIAYSDAGSARTNQRVSTPGYPGENRWPRGDASAQRSMVASRQTTGETPHKSQYHLQTPQHNHSSVHSPHHSPRHSPQHSPQSLQHRPPLAQQQLSSSDWGIMKPGMITIGSPPRHTGTSEGCMSPRSSFGGRSRGSPSRRSNPELDSTFGAPTPSASLKGSFSRAGSRQSAGRETAWSRLELAERTPGPVFYKPYLLTPENSRPVSPRCFMGTARRETGTAGWWDSRPPTRSSSVCREG